MKRLYNKLGAAIALTSTIALTGCLEEVLPTSGVTEDQLAGKDVAYSSIFWGMPSFLNCFNVTGGQYHYDWGYGSIMHIRDIETGDYATAESNYDHYTSWACNRYNDERYATTGFTWAFMNGWLQTCNKAVGTFDPEDENPLYVYYYGAARAFRAACYLDMARMYEFLPNDKVSGVNQYGNDVTGLTVPIVTEETTEEEAIDNPRATHEEMFRFIMDDLDAAETYCASIRTAPSKTVPSMAVVYGLKARAYMWDENYPKAAEYAKKAIQAGTALGSAPLTKDEWLNIATGFNTLSTPSWLWGEAIVKENDQVQTGIVNWTSWASNEANYGYAAAGPFQMIDKSLYDRINDEDWRKLSFVAPEDGELEGQEPFIEEDNRGYLPAYASLKFRPGFANTNDFNVGSAVAIPLMRIEEMWFIYAEAVAHSTPLQGKQILEEFMKEYRFDTYSCEATSQEDIIDEIVLQKRIELWGEGQTFFDIKRLNMSVTRRYEGTNFMSAARFNTNGRPAWMNMIIVRSEGANNKAVLEWNNPRTQGVYATN